MNGLHPSRSNQHFLISHDDPLIVLYPQLKDLTRIRNTSSKSLSPRTSHVICTPIFPQISDPVSTQEEEDIQGNFDFTENFPSDSSDHRQVSLSIIPRVSAQPLPLHPIEESQQEDQITRQNSIKTNQSPNISPRSKPESLSYIFKSQFTDHKSMKIRKKPQRSSLKELTSIYLDTNFSPRRLPSLRNVGNTIKIAKSMKKIKANNKYDI